MPRYVVLEEGEFGFPSLKSAESWATVNNKSNFTVAMILISSNREDHFNSGVIKAEHDERVRQKNQLRREVEEEIAIKLFGRGLK